MLIETMKLLKAAEDLAENEPGGAMLHYLINLARCEAFDQARRRKVMVPTNLVMKLGS